MLAFVSTIIVLLSIILIVYNFRLNKNAIFLALFFITFAVYGFAHYAIVESKNKILLAIAYNHFTPLVLLTGPFLFFMYEAP